MRILMLILGFKGLTTVAEYLEEHLQYHQLGGGKTHCNITFHKAEIDQVYSYLHSIIIISVVKTMKLSLACF